MSLRRTRVFTFAAIVLFAFLADSLGASNKGSLCAGMLGPSAVALLGIGLVTAGLLTIRRAISRKTE